LRWLQALQLPDIPELVVMLSFDIVDFVLDWQVVSWEKHYSPVGQFTAANSFSNPWISNECETQSQKAPFRSGSQLK
jgi:hypothetical protein